MTSDPMIQLVLSLFPGMDAFGLGFEREGFCVVQGPDVLFGRDVRNFHPPPGRFDGMIGGDPCQSHSTLAYLVRAKGLEPRFPDMTSEYQRVVEEAQPAWFLRENVPRAPAIAPDGYHVTSFLLDNSWLDGGEGMGEAQMRRRRFWFGVREGEAPNLLRWVRQAVFELPKAGSVQSVAADARAIPVRRGGSGKVKVSAVGGNDGVCKSGQLARTGSVTGRNEGRLGSPEKDYSPPRRSLAELLELQGLPADFFGQTPFTMQARRQMVVNAVPLGMARALARAVRKAMGLPLVYPMSAAENQA